MAMQAKYNNNEIGADVVDYLIFSNVLIERLCKALYNIVHSHDLFWGLIRIE